jgi:hypothetical protein
MRHTHAVSQILVELQPNAMNRRETLQNSLPCLDVPGLTAQKRGSTFGFELFQGKAALRRSRSREGRIRYGFEMS